LELRKAIRKLCKSSHVIGLQELNEVHAHWLQTNLPKRWRISGVARHGLHVLWDAEELTLLTMKVLKVFPDASRSDRYRHWRRYLEARAGQSQGGGVLPSIGARQADRVVVVGRWS
jgi:hypothetical protein